MSGLKASDIKEEMERIWREGHIACPSNLVRWSVNHVKLGLTAGYSDLSKFLSYEKGTRRYYRASNHDRKNTR